MAPQRRRRVASPSALRLQQQKRVCGKTDIGWLKLQPGASAKSAKRRERDPSVRQATQDDVSASRRFGSAQWVWRRLVRRVGAPAANCDCGVFFVGAAAEARSRVIRWRRYGAGGLNFCSWKPIRGVALGRPWQDHSRQPPRRRRAGSEEPSGRNAGTWVCPSKPWTT
jgi:hypothetical protein